MIYFSYHIILGQLYHNKTKEEEGKKKTHVLNHLKSQKQKNS